METMRFEGFLPKMSRRHVELSHLYTMAPLSIHTNVSNFESPLSSSFPKQLAKLVQLQKLFILHGSKKFGAVQLGKS